MAATRLIALHINKGKTVAQCLADRIDYSQNEQKTDNGKYISAYACDPRTCDEEFLFSKRQYEHITGRHQAHDVIAYQIRQSFKPGEITPEEANKIGYETAMRWTKGKHAFIVATHIDRAHIHNHIIYNSTSLDCSRKFKNLFLSGLAVARLSDLICLEHDLSIIDRKPYNERKKRTDYPRKPTYRDDICAAIDAALQKKPKSFEELARRADESAMQTEALLESVKADEARLQEIAVLKTHIINFSRSREVFNEYKASGYSRDFFEAHRDTLTLRRAAKNAFDEYMQAHPEEKSLPRVKELSIEYAEVLARKKKNYQTYRTMRKDNEEWQVAKSLVAAILQEDISHEEQKRQQEQEK